MAKKAKIVKGEDATLLVDLTRDDNGRPFDLTGYTEVTALFQNDDDTTLEKKFSTGGVTVPTAKGGQIQVALTDSDTEELKANEEGSFELEVEIGSEKHIVQFIASLEIIDRLF